MSLGSLRPLPRTRPAPPSGAPPKALQEKHRNTVCNAFVPLLGEEVTEAVLSHFPARDVEESVTREHLDRRLAEQNAGIDAQLIVIRADIDQRFTEQNAGIDARLIAIRADIDQRFTEQNAGIDRRFEAQNAEFDRKLDALRAEFNSKLDDLRSEVVELRLDVGRQINELRVDVAHQIAAESDKTFHRMLTLAGIGVGAMTILFAAFT